MGVAAITFDFNGTLSNDEPILCEIFRALFGGRGRPLSEQEHATTSRVFPTRRS
jgi:beta-phosphoglucomutase-like phosphatase (HAD superfamily)